MTRNKKWCILVRVFRCMGFRGIIGVKSKHEWEPNCEYCIRCGCSAMDFVNGVRVHCDEVGNAVGISHRIALKQMGVRDESSASKSRAP